MPARIDYRGVRYPISQNLTFNAHSAFVRLFTVETYFATAGLSAQPAVSDDFFDFRFSGKIIS